MKPASERRWWWLFYWRHYCCWKTASLYGVINGLTTGVVVYGLLILAWLLRIGPFRGMR